MLEIRNNSFGNNVFMFFMLYVNLVIEYQITFIFFVILNKLEKQAVLFALNNINFTNVLVLCE